MVILIYTEIKINFFFLFTISVSKSKIKKKKLKIRHDFETERLKYERILNGKIDIDV